LLLTHPQNPFPKPFTQLETLHLDLGGGHGDDASSIHNILMDMHNLTSFSLCLPNCDLTTCRIQGINYDYDFPSLKSFSLLGWADSTSNLANFLDRHQSIERLHLCISSDEDNEVELPATALPHLRALSLPEVNMSQSFNLFSQFLSPASARPIAQLRLNGLHESCIPILKNATKRLTCLEIWSYDAEEWRQDSKKLPFEDVLPALPELLEVSLHLPTENTSWRNDNDERVHPDPISLQDLRRLLSAFPPDTKICVVRMSDTRGDALPPDFIEELADVVPASLEFILWDVCGERTLYELHRTDDGKVEAKEGQPIPVRITTEADSWTSESVLDHLPES
jgi:hypothetical protein